MKKKVEQIEGDYRQRLERSHERLLDAQNKESSIREAMVQSKNDADEQILKLTARFEEEKNNLKMQLNHQVMVSMQMLRSNWWINNELVKGTECLGDGDIILGVAVEAVV